MKVNEKVLGGDAVVEILDDAKPYDIEEVFEYFHNIENILDHNSKDSEISKINRKKISINDISPIVRKVLKLCDQTRILSNGFFNISYEGYINPAGLLKGFAISEASQKLLKKGYKNFYLGIGNDMQIHGLKNGFKWRVGLENPITMEKKVINIQDKGIATSHFDENRIPIYNPLTRKIARGLKTITVIADSCLDADRFSTTVFAMGEKAVNFFDNYPRVTAYIVYADGKEYLTRGMANYM